MMDLENFLRDARGMFNGSPNATEFAAEHPTLVADLHHYDALNSIGIISSLLTNPELQANCLRLEVLVVLCTVYCKGDLIPTPTKVDEWFAKLNGGYCGRAEDPSEDLFIALVSNEHGNFRVFQGIREGNAFLLQRILNVLKRASHNPLFESLQKDAEVLLTLSDQVAQRAGLRENSLGGESPLSSLSASVTDKMNRFGILVKFDKRDLCALNISRSDLSKFVYSIGSTNLATETVMGSSLERRPLLTDGENITLALPSGVGSAIVQHVIETVLENNLQQVFENSFAEEFTVLFKQTQLLGDGAGLEVTLQRLGTAWVGNAMKQVDEGRFLQIILFVDSLRDYLPLGLNGPVGYSKTLTSIAQFFLSKSIQRAQAQDNFYNGLTLIVFCGYGRPVMDPIPVVTSQVWRVEAVSAHDFVTLGWAPDFSQLSLWRLLDARESLVKRGVEIVNPNGLLNLLAWSMSLKGHLVPHANLPDDFVMPGSHAGFVIPQNSLRELRHHVSIARDQRRICDTAGNWIAVARLADSKFEEDQHTPLYVSIDDISDHRLRAAFVTVARVWWIEISAQEGAPRENVYEYWRMLCVWVSRSADILNLQYPGLPPGPISLKFHFSSLKGSIKTKVAPTTENQIRNGIQIELSQDSSRINLTIGSQFADGLLQAKNVAETALVDAIVTGVAQSAGKVSDSNLIRVTVGRVVPNSDARWMHRFRATGYRDFVPRIRSKIISANMIDYAANRLGLGETARSEFGAELILGKQTCTSVLNGVVNEQLDQLCSSLNGFNRRILIERLVENHEICANDRDQWQRTSKAMLALHNDQQKTIHAIVKHHSELNGCFLAMRILLEAAVCECPILGGTAPGELEISRLMSKVLLVAQLGGWSDAIHWGAIEPQLKISPLGDVLLNHSFSEDVYEPFGIASGTVSVQQAVAAYSRLYIHTDAPEPIHNLFKLQFLDAWEAEFGTSLNAYFNFLDRLEGIEPAESFFSTRFSWLCELFCAASNASPQNAARTLNMLILSPREKWRSVGPEFSNKDWYPWRYGRRLSLIRKPLIQLDRESDPIILIVPGMIRESFVANVRWFNEGEIANPRSDEMRRWIGQANNVQRSEFNTVVGKRMEELGWTVRTEIKLTHLLSRSLEKDYGDIDVLAWRPGFSRVVAMECKDLQYRKAMGEVAEQLSDFRGEIRPDKNPDHLRRHLNRISVLDEYKEDVAKALNLSLPIQIEAHLVFRHAVPMKFAWNHMAQKVKLSLFEELDAV